MFGTFKFVRTIEGFEILVYDPVKTVVKAVVVNPAFDEDRVLAPGVAYGIFPCASMGVTEFYLRGDSRTLFEPLTATVASMGFASHNSIAGHEADTGYEFKVDDFEQLRTILKERYGLENVKISSIRTFYEEVMKVDREKVKRADTFAALRDDGVGLAAAFLGDIFRSNFVTWGSTSNGGYGPIDDSNPEVSNAVIVNSLVATFDRTKKTTASQKDYLVMPPSVLLKFLEFLEVNSGDMDDEDFAFQMARIAMCFLKADFATKVKSVKTYADFKKKLGEL